MDEKYDMSLICSAIDELNNKGNKKNKLQEIFNDQKITMNTESPIKSNLYSEIPSIVDKMILEAKKYLSFNQDMLVIFIQKED